MADNNTMIIDDRDMYVENVVNDYIKKNAIKLTVGVSGEEWMPR